MNSARILVVEDDATLGDGLRQTLTAQGYRASWARTGAEALELARDPHDIVLLDLTLPTWTASRSAGGSAPASRVWRSSC